MMSHRRKMVPVERQTLEAAIAVSLGARSFDEVAVLCGWASKDTAYIYLHKARALGLVKWEEHHHGTLRPCVTPVSV